MLKTFISRFVAFLLLTAPVVAGAAGLGRLAVLSPLGQPLHAEIELLSVGRDELSSLSVRLASPDAYRERDLEYGPALTGIRLSIEKRPDGRHYVKITSARPVNDLFVNLLVELNWGTGQLVRAYTALLDPPGFEPPAPPVAAAPQTRPMAKRALPAAETLAARGTASGGQYGPVKRGETLSQIARSHKPEGVAVEQMLVGLYRANPDAFINHNMNLLKAGATLHLPDREALTALPRAQALKEMRLQTANWKRYRRRLADMAVPASDRKRAKHEKAPGRVEDLSAEGKNKDVLRLSTGVPPGRSVKSQKGNTTERMRVLEEELIAREKALKEANDRIKQLESAVKKSAAAEDRKP